MKEACIHAVDTLCERCERDALRDELESVRDDAEDLRCALEVALRAERVMRENLTAVQARCTELLEEVRRLKRIAAGLAAPRICGECKGLGWVFDGFGPHHCPACGGSGKA